MAGCGGGVGSRARGSELPRRAMPAARLAAQSDYTAGYGGSAGSWAHERELPWKATRHRKDSSHPRHCLNGSDVLLLKLQ